MKATFNNKDNKYFSFREYLFHKYEGLIDSTLPSGKEIRILSSKINQTRGEERKKLEAEKKKLTDKYNLIMAYWRRLQ